jgi:hypothetical protein
MSPSIQYRLGVVAVIAILYYFGIRYKYIYPPQRQGLTGKGFSLIGIVFVLYILFWYESAQSPAIRSAYGATPGYA